MTSRNSKIAIVTIATTYERFIKTANTNDTTINEFMLKDIFQCEKKDCRIRTMVKSITKYI